MAGGAKATMRDTVLPCMAMVSVEGCIIGLTILASTAIARGMSPLVFVVYTNALGSIILLPLAFSRDKRLGDDEPVLTLHFLTRVFFLGLIGVCIAQNLAFIGLSYSSPIVACGMANQMPAFSFLLGIILRTTRFEWRERASQARLIGTVTSLTGAVSIALYRGPTIRGSFQFSPSLALRSLDPHRLLVFTSPHENWVLGCAMFAASSLLLAIWNVVQVGTVKQYPQVMKTVHFYSMFGTVQSAAVALLVERDDPNAWKLNSDFDLILIIVTAIFGSLIRSNVQLWCNRMKGPSFVPIFKPLGIPYASTFGCVFFADTFHYGSMMGALVCGLGYYTVLWGQMKAQEETTSMTTLQDQTNNNNNNNISLSDDHKVPLLQQVVVDESQV